jgi:citrate lyase subunit beta/citryl-CoA lyase
MWARTQLVVASRAAGLAAPIDSVFPVLDDEPSLLAETQVVKRLGYQGKFCIHPRQITVVNAVFTPSADEVRLAQEIVAAWRRALAAGSAAIRVRGMFVDYPVAQRAESVLRFASRLGVYPENVNPAEHPQSLEGEDDRVD